MTKTPLMVLLSLLLFGCEAGNGQGLDEQGKPITEQIDEPLEQTTPNISADINAIQAQIFTPICTQCHGGATPAAGQDLSTVERSLAALINVDSANSLFKRVLPGAPEMSYLYLKITGDSRAGARMPLGLAPLTDEQISAVRQWILLGARTPESTIAPTVINRVSALAIPKTTTKTNLQTANLAETKKLTPSHSAIAFLFWFNQPMKFEHLSSEQVIITINNEGLVRTLNSDEFTLEFPANNVLMLWLDLPEQINTRAMHQITIELNNSSISSLYSRHGQLLDGNRDGIDGGAFIYEYPVK